MKVFVTGYSGHLGPAVVKKLDASGAEVIGFDIDQKNVPGLADVRGGDILNYDQVKAAMTGCDEVLHMAAIAMPFYAREQEVFNVNASGTFNVFKACAELGIKRVSVTSSVNAIGYNFGVKVRDLSYLPVDGSHPLFATDPYSYSKGVSEDIGRYFYNRYGISSVFMRLGIGINVEDIRSLRARVDGLLSLPEKEGIREVRRIEAEMDERRLYALREAPPYRNGTEYVYECFTKEQVIWSSHVHNFLIYTHLDDLCDACVCALSARYEGSHPIFVSDYVNMLGIESAKLALLLYPGAKVDFDLLKGYDALADYREAEKMIGFRAKHSFTDLYKEVFG